MKQRLLGSAMFGLFLAAGPPVSGQTDQHTLALAAAIERAIADRELDGHARAGILIDTARSAIETRVALQLAQELGVKLGRSEEHCRRFLSRYGRGGPLPPIGYEVHGVDAIVTVGRMDLAADSAHIWITTARGSGPYVGAPRSYIVRRAPDGWRAETHIVVSPHATCSPQLFTAPLVLAAEAVLAELQAPNPLCYDPTGFFLHERDSVAMHLGAEIRGRWVPLIDGETPEFARDPCEQDSAQWGSVIRFLQVDWEAPDVIHVVLEARAPLTQSLLRRRYTLSQDGPEWIVIATGR